MNQELDDIEWEEVFFDGDLFVDDQRVRERHGAQIDIAFAYESKRYKAVSADISDGGLFVVTEEILPANAKFKLVFKLPTCDEPTRAIGRVAWIRTQPRRKSSDGTVEPVGFGVQFVTLSDEARQNIQEYVELRATLLMGAEEGG